MASSSCSSFASRCHPRFVPLLERFGLQNVERHPDTIYGIWPDFTLSYVNPGWIAFAAGNGGDPDFAERWRIGARVLDAIPNCLMSWYRAFVANAFGADGVHPPQDEYECSSPELFRTFLMTAYALRAASGTGLLVVNSLRVELSMSAARPDASCGDPRAYVDAAGLIHQCVHCRRVQTSGDSAPWHFIPNWIRQPPGNVSHTLCSLCLQHYYPRREARRP